MTLRKITHIFICYFSFLAFASSQSTLDLSDNTGENTFRFPGTVLSLDTSGLNLQLVENMKVLFNESEQTVIIVEQLMTALEEYESTMSKLSSLEAIFFEQEAVFNEYSGKLTHGKEKIQGIDREFWILYLGNQEHVLRIMASYNIDLHSKYSEAFEKTIKSFYINEEVELSIYEDLPFYLDETKFPYTKHGSMMPQSIILFQNVHGSNRMVTMAYLSHTQEDIEELKKNNSDDTEVYEIGDKIVIVNIKREGNTNRFSGNIILGNNIIMMNGNADTGDGTALDEFREMAKSVKFRRN